MTSTPAAFERPIQRRKGFDGFLAVAALLLIVVVWVLGGTRADRDLMPSIREALPEAGHFVRQDDGLYAAWTDGSETTPLGYVVIGEADGYGGPLRLAVAVDPAGVVIGVAIVDHKETPAWMDRVLHNGLVGRLVGKRSGDEFAIGTDVDGVTGATQSSKALAEAVLESSRAAARILGLPLDPLPPPKIVFGIPEVVLLVLFAVGFLGHQRRFPYTRQVRWATMVVGMVVLGFIYNAPVTLAYVVKLMLGYWPQWQTNLYWYLLIGGILFVFTVDNKNPYCRWFCPFGAAQECMGAVGGAKARSAGSYHRFLTWLQRALALTAILVGVYLRSPGLASYELFGTLFDLVGSNIQFLALALVLIAALFVSRPWCNYLCPITPVMDLIRVLREMVKETWRKIPPRNDTA